MQFKNFNNFIRGVFEKDGDEARVADEFLTKLHNMDVDLTGRVKSRWGYGYWPDLLANNSLPSSNDYPNIEQRAGFPERIQSIFQYIDVAGVAYIVVISDGKVYVEVLHEDNKQWSVLNPNSRFVNRVKHIDSTSYLDLLFFNDHGENVYYYDSQSYSEGSWIVVKNRFAYFAADTIYFRNYSTFDDLPDEHVKIENLPATNPEGTSVYDGLNAIGYPYLANLQFGFCVKTGNEELGVSYFVLDNWNNARADNKCQIVRFNGELIAQDYIEVDMDANGEILNFSYYKESDELYGHLYLHCEDGKIHKFDETNMSDELLDDGDLASFIAPVNTVNSKKQYTISVNQYGIYLYTVKLPDKTDWYQPSVIHPTYNSAVPPFNNISYYGWGLHSPAHGLYAAYPIPLSTDNYSGNKTFMRNIFNSGNYKQFGGQSLYFDKKFTHHPCGSVPQTYWRMAGITSRLYTLQTVGFSSQRLNIFDVVDTISNLWLSAWAIWGPHNHVYRYTSFCSPYTSYQDKLYNYALETFSNTASYTGKYAWRHPYGDPAGSFRGMTVVGSKLNFSTQLMYAYDPYFQYDKNNNKPAGGAIYNDFSNSLIKNVKTLMLDRAAYNSDIFSNRTTPLYVLLAGIKHNDRTFLTRSVSTLAEGVKTWKFILPLGKITDIEAPLVLLYENHKLYFGTNMAPGTSAVWGKYLKMDLRNHLYDIYGTAICSRKLSIDADVSDRWVMKSDQIVNRWVISNDWSLDNSGLPQTDLTDFENYRANLFFHAKREIVDSVGKNLTDRIKPLGTPSEPNLILFSDPGSNFQKEASFKYYMSFEFYTGKITPLSPGSESIFIPDNGAGNNVRIIISELNLKDPNGVIIYIASDVFKIQVYRSYLPEGLDNSPENWSIPDLFGTLEKRSDNNWYDTDLNAVTGGNQGAKQFFIAGDETAKYIPGIKIAVTGSTSNDGEYTVVSSVFAGVTTTITVNEAIPTGTFDGDISFIKEVLHDYEQSLTVNPFTPINVIKYPVNNILIHKSRLLLINLLNEENSSVVGYSDTDLARSIAPDNVRPIESGDGDYLVCGESMGDYCYLFKSTRIYAVLGDFPSGQIIDVDKKVGTKYKNLVTSFGSIVYFMNDFGIYIIAGNRVANLMQERVRNYFDKNRKDSIDFTRLDQGFVDIDIEHREIHWHVPQKKDGVTDIKNNLVIIYDVDNNFFKTRSYYNKMYSAAYVKNVKTNEYEYLMGDYDGNIFKITQTKHDDHRAIDYVIRTKHFNMGTDSFKKLFKVLKVAGKFLNNIRVTYWIDGERYPGNIDYRDGIDGHDDVFFKVWRRGKSRRMAVEISGQSLNDPPVEIDEIIIGFDRARGIR